MRTRAQRFKALTENEKQLVREIPHIHKEEFTPAPKEEYEKLPHPFSMEALEELRERERVLGASQGRVIKILLTFLLIAFLLTSCRASHAIKSVTTKDHYNKRGKLESKTVTTIYKHRLI